MLLKVFKKTIWKDEIYQATNFLVYHVFVSVFNHLGIDYFCMHIINLHDNVHLLYWNVYY